MSLRSHAAALAGALTLAVAAPLSGCGDDDEPAPGAASKSAISEVTIGTAPWIGYGPLWIAEERGFDRDNGVDLKLVTYQTDAEFDTAFASGRMDGANGSVNVWMRLASHGLDFKIVLMEDVSLEGDAVVARKGIDEIADVEGKRVGFEEASVSELLFRHALSDNGLEYDSFEHVAIPASNVGAALLAGKIDVAVTYEPYVQELLARGDGFKTIYTAAERPGLISDALVFDPGFAEENDEAVVGVLRAWNDAVEFYRSNPEEAKAIIAKNVGSKPDELAASFDGVELYDLTESQRFLDEELPTLWSDLATILADQDQIESEPDLADYLDTSFGERALAE